MHTDVQSLRELDIVLSGCGYAIAMYVYVFFLRQPGTGHRRLCLAAAVMFGIKALGAIFLVHALWYHDYHIAVWVNTAAAAVVLTYSCYLYITRYDSVVTLRRSEAIDQIWTWKLNNAKQVALNSVFLAETTLKNVQKLSPHRH